MKKLPKKFQGAAVVRGLGMKSEALAKLLERRAMDQFDATLAMWVVVDDDALQDLDNTTQVKGFSTQEDAVRFARAMANGNVNQRVLRVTEQVLVVATENEL